MYLVICAIRPGLPRGQVPVLQRDGPEFSQPRNLGLAPLIPRHLWFGFRLQRRSGVNPADDSFVPTAYRPSTTPEVRTHRSSRTERDYHRRGIINQGDIVG